MAVGMLDWIAEVMYGDLPLQYGERSSVANEQFAAGGALKKYLIDQYPEIKPAPAGKMLPAFIDCRESKVFTEPLTKSKKCKDQVKVTLPVLVGRVLSLPGRNVIAECVHIRLVQVLSGRPSYITAFLA
ncbi:hypothetical protein CONLIGDRAFT_684982 [Coniochaeta ligniaria NRRL 30616]|uniref:Uncharacterized protein n=1 Tax=Coniochaeta ligniaria NRRL 30616 TaxID=1408157 RepID=A0A1J7IBP7_9PEZI|nr:hypothetical protein CONLIGDRAFT_684982 [Coniochaeta ligniaria NRRL 30616]